MKKSFYHFLVKYRQPEANDELSTFAAEVYEDHSFPKHSMDYYEISNYLELNGNYQTPLSLFDQVWEMYEETEENK